MSRTDKTNPPWVKTTRREGNRKPWRIYHLPSCDGWCAPVAIHGYRWGPFDRCEVWCRHSDNGKIYGRRPKRETRKSIGRNNGARAELVRLRRDWRLETDREDIDSMWHAPTARRHLFDPWWWD